MNYIVKARKMFKVTSTALIVVLGVMTSATQSFANPIVSPKDFESVKGLRVSNSGAILKNQTAFQAHDVHIGFEIPSTFVTENINQVSIAFGAKGAAAGEVIKQFIKLGDQASASFSEDRLLRDENNNPYTIGPKGELDIALLIDSKRRNAVSWTKDGVYFTDERGLKLESKFYGGSFIVEAKSPLTYTFINGGNVELFINEFSLGWSDFLVNPENFIPSPGVLNDLISLDNGGLGWSLSPESAVSFEVPFLIPSGAFLIADVVGTGDPNGPDALPIHFIQQHEVPEPSTMLLLCIGFLGFILFQNKRYNSMVRTKCQGMSEVLPNNSINTDWLTAGFARLQPADYVRR